MRKPSLLFVVFYALCLIIPINALPNNQTKWGALPKITALGSPVISSHSDGMIYVVCIGHKGYVGYTTTKTPNQWADWQVIGPAPKLDGNYNNKYPVLSDIKSFLAAPDTPPVLIRDKDRLYLFIRGKDNNLHVTNKHGSSDWSSWMKISSGGKLLGRFSVAVTRDESGANPEFHVLHRTEVPLQLVGGTMPAIEYRRYNSNMSQVFKHIDRAAYQGTLGTDGANQLFAAVIPNVGGGIILYRGSRPWGADWKDITPQKLHPSNLLLPDTLDISNVEYFADSFHFAYTSKRVRSYLNQQTPDAGQMLSHVKVKPKTNYVSIKEISSAAYTAGEYQATLAVYRNKLVMAYRDDKNSVRYARLDNTDPKEPWIPPKGSTVADSKTMGRPALGFYDSGSLSAGDAFGKDMFAVVKGEKTNQIYFINFSRAIFKQYLHQIGIGVAYFLDESAPTAVDFENKLYIFLRDREHGIQLTSINDVPWSGTWTDLGGAVSRRVTPASVTFNNELYTFAMAWINNAGRQIQARKCGDKCGDTKNWSAWQVIQQLPRGTAINNDGPGAAILGDKLYLFISAGEKIYTTNSADGISWKSWKSLPIPPDYWRLASAGSSVGVYAFNGKLHLFARFMSKKKSSYTTSVWEIESDKKGSWSGSSWKNLGFETPSDPVAIRFGDKLHLFIRDKWNGLWQNSRDLSWEGWVRVPGGSSLTASGPAAAVFANKLYLFRRALDYELHEIHSIDGKNWSSWSQLPINAASLYGPFEPIVENLPEYSEIGYAFWQLPSWLVENLFIDKVKNTPEEKQILDAKSHMARYGAHVASKYTQFADADKYPVWINFSDHAWIGAGITTNYNYDYEYLWHELFHAALGAMGIGVGENVPSIVPGVPYAGITEAKNLFGKSHPTEKDGRRPIGFAGWYTVGIQHDMIQTIQDYFNDGVGLRTSIAYDKKNGTTQEQKTLLENKYNWVKKYIYKGVEFRRHGEQL